MRFALELRGRNALIISLLGELLALKVQDFDANEVMIARRHDDPEEIRAETSHRKDARQTASLVTHTVKGSLRLCAALVADLQAFDKYAAMLHSDTSGGHTRTDVSDGESQHFASAALRFIQIGKLL